MTPTVGRIVHYHRPGLLGAAPLAAIVTAADGTDRVSLVAFEPNACRQHWVSGVQFAENPTPGCWNWPPRN
ncbi:hypothetical protein SEA_TINIBUG_4 [Mycobacterium Phage TiniBug]|uniref:Uncharacterized protein n=1 Tax=Mycobacterium phage Urkel TaxID=1912978 RepID=A0A1I9S4N6_9CAUD|nr:hypothetical protein I5H07_gp04 [Mycobacterium phage Urkel]AOZ61336.1 hypothetical protein SEA_SAMUELLPLAQSON_4 [Mycobacterium phage SamuelLPlaqson]AOZ61433.1 hypothetical protein SEA_DRHAYES_4 [Mycobacterium phage DrHayes]AOZ61530.1 hypothetical protein SEA_URKEL_4 [Mycobacterium phage Urkel]WNM75360.1 hypothetical protein SEA_TINIBUG_4 [Mycobacterium Phage TiniBug]